VTIAVISFPGSNCDHDAIKAVRKLSGREPVRVWHTDTLPADTKLAVLPGGFSFGDYLRSGAIARFSPVMKSVQAYAQSGGVVLGICNGFQILLESGLLPGAMLRNRSLHFKCEWVHLRTERRDTLFSDGLKPVLRIPIAHGEGNWYADDETFDRVVSNNQVLFRYCAPDGTIQDNANPNGSRGNIAGLLNEQGNVLGMMPHPERALDPDLGGEDGIEIWASLFRRLDLNV
jgi:phosphoribosylformylglycinamidine synthase I